MHIIQEKLLKIIAEKNIGNLKLREIGELVGAPHPQIIKHHLSQLEQKGFIIFNKSKKIIYKIDQNTTSPLRSIPILGSADCGPATFFADQNIEGYLKVSNKLIHSKNKLFAIRAVGQSMNKANINGDTIDDGDYVIIDSENKNISDNDYVLSIIDDVCNIKKIRFIKNNTQALLLSESSIDQPPIVINYNETNYLINGKVTQVIKKYE